MAAAAILASTIAGAHAETSQVKLPDGRIVQCDPPPKHSDRVGKCADGELIVWNDRDQSYYVTAPQQNGATWGTITIPSEMSTFSPGLMYMGQLAADTARNARRQQALDALWQCKQMVPTATAADLRAYWEQLSAGDNWLRSQMPQLN
jgi:hypothetical protein